MVVRKLNGCLIPAVLGSAKEGENQYGDITPCRLMDHKVREINMATQTITSFVLVGVYQSNYMNSAS